MKMPKLVSIWNPKGGQGKSLLSLNLAAAASEMGLVPLVICQDQQGTSMNYFRAGNLTFNVIDKLPELPPQVDIIFFDHQASDWEVPNTKLLVMPVKPARDQYATYIDAKKRAESKNKDIITIVTDGQGHRQSEQITTTYLEKQGAFVIPSSGVFSRASDEYRTIFDSTMNKAYKISERRKDIQKILAAILLKVGEKLEDKNTISGKVKDVI